MSTCLAYDTGVQDAKWIPKWHADNTIFKPSDAGVATMSDEGDASGVHLHMQVNVGTFKGTPVNLFHWADVAQAGITSTGDVGGKQEVTLHWNNDASAIVNDTERIASIRANETVQKKDRDGNLVFKDGKPVYGEIGVNHAYAWEAGKNVEQMVRVVWVGETKDHQKINAWIAYDAFQKNDFSQKWDPITQKWIAR